MSRLTGILLQHRVQKIVCGIAPGVGWAFRFVVDAKEVLSRFFRLALFYIGRRRLKMMPHVMA